MKLFDSMELQNLKDGLVDKIFRRESEMIINLRNVETRIKEQHQMNVTEFFEMCLSDDMELVDISELAGCSVGNLKRIARKHKFSFELAKPTPMFSENNHFKLRSLNNNNFLSRQWIKMSA